MAGEGLGSGSFLEEIAAAFQNAGESSGAIVRSDDELRYAERHRAIADQGIDGFILVVQIECSG